MTLIHWACIGIDCSNAGVNQGMHYVCHVMNKVLPNTKFLFSLKLQIKTLWGCA